MASGKFDKGVEKVRPGTYVNFIDEHDYSADGTGNSASVKAGSGSGNNFSLPDFYLGHGAEVVVNTSDSDTIYSSDYLVCKEDGLYSGTEELQEVS